VGVNTFLPKEYAGNIFTEIELIHSTENEKGLQIENVLTYRRTATASRWRAQPRTPAVKTKPGKCKMSTGCAICSLWQISHALYDVGVEYGRNT